MTDLQPAELIGGDVAGVRVTLRLFADDLDPDRVTEKLGVKPTRAYRPGDRVSSRSEARRTQGTWQLRSSLTDAQTIEEHIASILDALGGDLNAWERATQGLRKDLYCGVFIESQVSGLSLGIGTLEQLVRRGLSIEFDLVVRNEPDDDE
jgi:hypothetical protein